MPHSDALAALERTILAFSATDPLETVRAILPRYVAEVESQLRHAAVTREQARSLEHRAYELLGRITAIALSTREAAAAELSRLRSVASYEGPGTERRHVRADV
jgi:hypothetical protein